VIGEKGEARRRGGWEEAISGRNGPSGRGGQSGGLTSRCRLGSRRLRRVLLENGNDLGAATIFCNGVRVSGVLVNGVVFVSHEFYQAFLSEEANGWIRRWASIFRFGFGSGIGCWSGASGGVSLAVTGTGGESLTGG